MRITKIGIKNYRSIKEQDFVCSGYNVFVGPNGSGKSTVLRALNLFFGEQQSFSEDDFTDRDTTAPIEVALTFDSLSEQAVEEFKHYVRHDEMTVVAEVISQPDNSGFQYTRRGERLVNPDFANFFDKPKSPAKDRRDVYETLQDRYPGLEDQTSVDAMEKALREFEEHMPANQKVMIRSQDEFFGISRGTDRIRKFLTWVYVPAVKEAATESEEARNTHLGRLIQHTVRSSMNYHTELEGITEDARNRYDLLLSDQQEHLAGLESRLTQRLQDAVTGSAGIELKWRSNEKSVTISEPTATVRLEDSGFTGEVQNFGHGLQRTFLLIMLQELLADESQRNPTLILGCEEPELYQHPPQARHLASVLKQLTTQDAQVYLTTHSPYFVDIESLDGLKKIAKPAGHSEVHVGDLESLTQTYNECFIDSDRKIDAIRAKLCIQLQPRATELFFSDFVVLVEGISDKSYLDTYMALSGDMQEFQELGGNIIEAGGKSSLILLMLLTRQFQVPCYVVFDCDGDVDRPDHRAKHEKDNKTAFKLAGQEENDPFPNEVIVNDSLTAWRTNIEDVVEGDLGALSSDATEHGRKAAGNLKDCRKNPFFVSASMKYGWEKDCRFETLKNVVGKMLSMARHNKAPARSP